MNKIVIRPLDSIVSTFGNQINAVGEGKARQAFARAVNRTGTMVRTRVIREVAKQSSIPRSILIKAIRLDKAAHRGTGPIEATVHASGKPLSLKHFKPRQFKFGVRAKVWGKTERFKSAFIYGGTYKSGKLAYHGHVMEREGSNRFPWRVIRGPAIPDELVKGNSAAAFAEIVATHLPARIRHELSRMLPG